MKLQNDWALDSLLGISLPSKDLGINFLFVNIYGPYTNAIKKVLRLKELDIVRGFEFLFRSI